MDVIIKGPNERAKDGSEGLIVSSAAVSSLGHIYTDGYIVDSDGDAITIDEVTRTITTTTYPHHEMHEGSHYFVKTWMSDTAGTGNQTFFAFTTPVNGRRIHAKALIAPDVDFTINIYEGSVITGGTPVIGVNNDRDSANVAGLTAVAGPTHTTPGTVIWSARNGGGRNAVGVAPGLNYEIIAAADTVYVFELIKNTTSDGIVDIDFFWYEHTSKA